MAKNEFKSKKFEDHEIIDVNGKKVGTIRVKPSGILWKARNSQSWQGIDIDAFANYMQKNGKPQSK